MAVPLRAGDVVVDKYRIERQLGSGGMGVVVQATHLQLNQSVALKFLIESGLEPDIAAERFLREARATFRLRSEHTVRVMDVGTLPTGEPFIVMEMLVGKDFKQLLGDRGPLPVDEAGHYMMQVCAALAEAHALGIVHRDLKARNLFVTTRVDGSPCVKVLDFGISKLAAEAELAPLTRPDMGMGSPRYMAPEQWTSASTVDARADIYAAGAVFYELLTGAIPLAGLPLAEVIKRVRAGAVPTPKEKRPDLPDAICRVVMRALRPRPEERFPTAQHFSQAIREALPAVAADARPKAIMSTTVQTAVVNREVLLARAQLEARMSAPTAGPSSSAPTPKEQPPAEGPSTDPEDGAPLPSSTLEDGVPAASSPMQAPATRPLPMVGLARPEASGLPRAPQARAPTADDNPFAEDLATVVTKSPIETDGAGRPNHHATLQVAEAPPEIQALRNKHSAPPAPPAPPPRAAPVRTSYSVVEPTIDDPHPHGVPRPPSSAPLPRSHPLSSMPAGVPARRFPAWLFWTFLVVSFCVAGGVVAALLTRLLP